MYDPTVQNALNRPTHFNDTNPATWGQKTFRVNLITDKRYEWVNPNRTSTDGNETSDEESNQPRTKWAYFPDSMRCNRKLYDGDTFDVSGEVAYYLKKTYVSNPPSPYDLLQIVSES